jgi:hypothetical protein
MHLSIIFFIYLWGVKRCLGGPYIKTHSYYHHKNKQNVPYLTMVVSSVTFLHYPFANNPQAGCY